MREKNREVNFVFKAILKGEFRNFLELSVTIAIKG